MAGRGLTTKERPAGTWRAGRSFVQALAPLWVIALLVGACGSGETAEGPAGTLLEVVDDDFDVQGHRGARGLRPENTLPSFEKSLDLGVTTLELDLHLSADGEVVVWHDPVVDPSKCRLGTNASVPDPAEAPAEQRAIRSLTAEQLRSYACDSNPEPVRFPDQVPDPGELAGTNYGIVTLAELFEFVAAYAESDSKTEAQRENAATVGFNIETKRIREAPETIGDDFDGVSPGPFELAVLEAVEAAGIVDRVIVQSFDHRSLRAIAQTGSAVRLAPLTRDPVRDPAQYAAWGASIWSPRASTLDEDDITAAHQAGLLVVPWTVNDVDDMQRLIDMGVDGLITDRPDLLLGES